MLSQLNAGALLPKGSPSGQKLYQLNAVIETQAAGTPAPTLPPYQASQGPPDWSGPSRLHTASGELFHLITCISHVLPRSSLHGRIKEVSPQTHSASSE